MNHLGVRFPSTHSHDIDILVMSLDISSQVYPFIVHRFTLRAIFRVKNDHFWCIWVCVETLPILGIILKSGLHIRHIVVPEGMDSSLSLKVEDRGVVISTLHA